MITSESGVDFIRAWERFSAFPYQDLGGIWTIGYGSLYDINNNRVTQTTPAISVDTAEALLKRDLIHSETAVNIGLKKPMTQSQFDALVSLCYNIGVGHFSSSTALKLINQGSDPSLAWVAWDHVQGKESAGLENRRMAELKLFRSPPPDLIA